MNNFLSTLGLARRAGRLTYGYDMVVSGLRSTQVILLSKDISSRTLRNVEAQAQAFKIPVVRVPFNKEILGASIGAKPICVIGVTDRGFAGILRKCIEGGNEFGAEIQSS